jgi:hypothetical protein
MRAIRSYVSQSGQRSPVSSAGYAAGVTPAGVLRPDDPPEKETPRQPTLGGQAGRSCLPIPIAIAIRNTGTAEARPSYARTGD